MTARERAAARRRALDFFKRAGIVLTPAEKRRVVIGDFGLGDFKNTGYAIFDYVNTKRVCAKEMVLQPGQTCPQHRHPPLKGGPGKEETFRCRYGSFYLYVPGKPAHNPKVRPPKAHPDAYAVFHEIVLKPGDQYTLQPNTWHWFRAGSRGAVISEFSTTSYGLWDVFADPDVERWYDRLRKRTCRARA